MADFELTWESPEGVAVEEYVVRKKHPDSEGATWLDVPGGSTRSTSLMVRDLFGRERVEFGIAPIVAGLEAPERDWTILSVVPDDTSDFDAPENVGAFLCSQVGSQIVARWTAPTSPFLDYIEIRMGTSWEAGVVMTQVSATDALATFGWWGAGETTFYAKFFTIHGLESATANSSTITIVADGEWPVQGTHDEHGGSWGGTLTGTETSGGNLQITDYLGVLDNWTGNLVDYTGPLFGTNDGSGTYITAAQDAGATVEEAVEVNATWTLVTPSLTLDDYLAPLTPHPESDPDPDDAGSYQFIFLDETLRDGVALDVAIDTTPDSGGSPTWDGFRRWVPGAIYTYRQVRLRITLTMPFPLFNISVTGFTWKRRRKNFKDEGSVSVSGTGGTAITFDAPFTVAPQVTASADSSSALIVTVDSITTSGANLFVFNAAGTEQGSGTLRWIAAGV